MSPVVNPAGARTNLADEAVQKVRKLILTDELRPGDRLPPEKELAAQLGLSRNSLREAVRALSQQGVFVTRQGSGTFVTSLKPEVLLESLSFAIDLLQDEHIVEVLELRRVVEPAGTAIAARRISPSALEELDAILTQFEMSSDWEEMVQLDIEFHNQIILASANATLHALCIGLSQQTLRARVWRGLVGEGIAETTMRQHRSILASLIEGDAISAHAEALSHVLDTERWVRARRSDDSAGVEH